MTMNSRNDERHLLQAYPQLNHPQVNRRSLLALGSLLALDLAGCGGGGSDASSGTTPPVNGGVVTTLAGTAGISGSTNGTGTAASFSTPSGLTMDASGALYVADFRNNLIRKIV
jgi:hypothetical protein